MLKSTLDTLSEDILHTIAHHLVQAPLQDVRERGPREPTLLPLFNLAQTCRRLQEVLNKPVTEDAYWRKIMLDSGTGRPCDQPPVLRHVFPGSRPGEIRTSSAMSRQSWKTLARRQAHFERNGGDDGVFYGRGIPAPINSGPVSEYYDWVPQVMGKLLPRFPHPETHRALSPEECKKYSVYLNLPALHQEYEHLLTLDDFFGRKSSPPLPNFGTFITQPPVQELEVYLCFREGVVAEMRHTCERHEVYEEDCISSLISLGLDLPHDLAAILQGCINSVGSKTPWPPIKLKNPTGITMADFRDTLEAWISKSLPMPPALLYCLEVATKIQEIVGCPEERDEWTEHLWSPPTFPAPSDEPQQSDCSSALRTMAK